jgi:hypothetical protein
LVNHQSIFVGKISLLEKELIQAKQKILPTINVARITTLNTQNKKLMTEKLDLEIGNKKLREENLEIRAQVAFLSLKAETVEQLEQTLKDTHNHDFGKRIIELTNKNRDSRLEELRAQRELEGMKAKEAYHNRINRGLSDDIAKLEEEISNAELKFNERDEMWRVRYGKLVSDIFGDNADLYMADSGNANVKEILKKGIKQDESKLENLDKKISIREIKGEFTCGKGEILTLDQSKKIKDDNKLLKLELSQAQKENERLRLKIDGARDGIQYNLQNDTAAMNELQNDTKQMAEAAHATIQTLQTIIDEKTVELDRRDGIIEKLREDLGEAKTDLVSKNSFIERLKRERDESEKTKAILDGVHSMTILDRLQRMTNKELEMVIIEYETKINTLTSQLTDCEASNRELVGRLREVKMEKAKVENSMIKLGSDAELDALVRDKIILEETLKKKNKE